MDELPATDRAERGHQKGAVTMSAFICSEYHIKRLAVFASTENDGTINVDPRYFKKMQPAARQEVLATRYADILYQENIRSVRHRYPDCNWDDLPGPIEKKIRCVVSCDDIRHHTRRISALEILKLCKCLEYQSCETDDYKNTLAWELLDAIRDEAIRQLPGYDAAPWSIYEQKVMA